MLVGESVVANSQLCGQRRQPRVRCPQLKASNKGGGEEVRIDPANTAPVQSSIAHKFYDIRMGHHWRLVHSLVVGQQLSAATLIADEQLAEDEVVAAHLVTTQKAVQFGRVRRSIGKETNPYRSVNQDDHTVA